MMQSHIKTYMEYYGKQNFLQAIGKISGAVYLRSPISLTELTSKVAEIIVKKWYPAHSQHIDNTESSYF